MAKIDLAKIIKESRDLNVQELVQLLRMNKMRFFCWGVPGFKNHSDRVLSFRVTGLLHTGNVYICVNYMDLFDVYITSSQNNVKIEMKDIYFDDLFNRIDEVIERKAK